MRMDRRQTVDARQIVNAFALDQLERIFRVYGEEPRARRIAQAIVAGRKQHTLETTAQLVQLIERIKGRGRRDHIRRRRFSKHCEIAVNQELQQLEQFLERGYETLRPGGRMVIISFHSWRTASSRRHFAMESRLSLPAASASCRCGWSQKVKLLTKKPIMPSASEIHANPRARSAKNARRREDVNASMAAAGSARSRKLARVPREESERIAQAARRRRISFLGFFRDRFDRCGPDAGVVEASGSPMGLRAFDDE